MVLFFYTEGVPLLLHRRYSFSFTPKVFLFFYTEGIPFLLHRRCSFSFTPKVFANFSPGLSFGNPGERDPSAAAQPCQGCARPNTVSHD